MPKLITNVVASTLLLAATAALASSDTYVYNITGSNNDQNAPTHQNVPVYLAPYDAQTCDMSAGCSYVFTMPADTSDKPYQGQYNLDSASVWISEKDQNNNTQYYRCTKGSYKYSNISISAHIGGCTGQS